MQLTNFRSLGRSGLIVSPFSLGTMTFGTQRWGSSDDMSQTIFNTYVDAGGNFIDTADVYAGGRSEELVGQYIADRDLRDKLVLATKFSFNAGRGNPNTGGNGRKNMYRALDNSLSRLKTDYIDLYWMHVWDTVTPVEEIMQSLSDLVRAGKIRYFGFSDMPAWFAAKAATLATAYNMPAPIAMQLEYSLVERSIEREHIPAARACGMGVCPWSPLAGGFLAGKYQRDGQSASGNGRLSGNNPFGTSKFTNRNWSILDTLQTVSAELDRPAAQVALAWTVKRPGITASILGASSVDQLADNLAALDITFTANQLDRLNTASAPEPTFPYPIFEPAVNRSIFGGYDVEGWQ
jgi:aryl-alcohol dehydrogenase-like predicted oxidoreductase